MTDENGLYYMRARYYNPDIKRFINLDVLLGSIDEGQSLNRYAYVNGNPISYVDPFGTCVESGEAGHMAFDAAGFLPVAGLYFDATNAIWYAAEGDWTNFGCSAIALIPVAGDIFQAGRLGIKYLDDVGAVNRLIKKAKSAEKQLTKGAGKTDILSGKTLTNQTGKVNNYVSGAKGNAAAQADFNAMNPSNVRTYSNGTVVGDLPDGTTINMHPSTSLGGIPTVEIYNPNTGISTKIRY